MHKRHEQIFLDQQNKENSWEEEMEKQTQSSTRPTKLEFKLGV
jgi:hypothetical protein